MKRDAIYFVRPARRLGSYQRWAVVKVLEHGPYHDRRPPTWVGPYASDYDARLAAYDLERASRCDAGREEER
jgi:hypothetical protein